MVNPCQPSLDRIARPVRLLRIRERNMLRTAAFGGASRGAMRGLTSIACLAFVTALAVAFWASALWIGGALLHLFVN